MQASRYFNHIINFFQKLNGFLEHLMSEGEVEDGTVATDYTKVRSTDSSYCCCILALCPGLPSPSFILQPWRTSLHGSEIKSG